MHRATFMLSRESYLNVLISSHERHTEVLDHGTKIYNWKSFSETSSWLYWCGDSPRMTIMCVILQALSNVKDLQKRGIKKYKTSCWNCVNARNFLLALWNDDFWSRNIKPLESPWNQGRRRAREKRGSSLTPTDSPIIKFSRRFKSYHRIVTNDYIFLL